MDQKKKPFVKPTMTIHYAGTPEYNRLKALLDTEDHKNLSKETSRLDPSAGPDNHS